MKRSAKVDANQNEIVSALRSVGAEILFTHQLKDAFDILVGFMGNLYIMEIKNPEYLPAKFFKMNFDDQREYLKGKLTKGEKKCFEGFERVNVVYHIIFSVQCAFNVLGITDVYQDSFFK